MKRGLRTSLVVALLTAVVAGVALWLLPLERPRHVLELPTRLETSLRLSPDSTKLATTSPEGQPTRFVIRVWDVNTGELISTLSDRPIAFVALVFAPDSRSIAGSTQEGAVYVWDVASGRRTATYTIAKDRWQFRLLVGFTPAGQLVWEDVSTRGLADVETGVPVPEPPDGSVLPIDWGATGAVRTVRTVATKDGSVEGPANMHSKRNRVTHWFPASVAGVHGIEFTPDGQVVVGQGLENLRQNRGPGYVSDLRRGVVARFPPLDDGDSWVLSPDGRSIAVRYRRQPGPFVRSVAHLVGMSLGGESVSIDVFNVQSGTRVAHVPGGEQVALAADGRTMAVSRDGGTVEVWDLPVSKPWAIILGGAALAGVLAFLVARHLGRRAEGAA
jgi:WD40 repeat protein